MKVVVIFSGGIDSTTVIYQLLKQTDKEVYPIYFNYGQKTHEQEIECIKKLYGHLNGFKRLKIFWPVDISNYGLFRSSLTDWELKVPDNKSDLSEAETAEATFVPFRNVVFVSFAVAYAESIGASEIYTGTFNLGYTKDSIVHADASPEMAEELSEVVRIGTSGRVKLVSPFYNIYKDTVFKIANQLEVPFHDTWTCYAGGYKIQCGVCNSCEARRKGLINAGIIEQTKYAKEIDLDTRQ